MKKINIIIVSLALICAACSLKKESGTVVPSGDLNQTEKSTPVFVVVEDMPSFKGGDVNVFREWVQARVEYPESLLKKKIEGKVFVMFIVEPDGSVTNVEIMRGLHPMLDKETIRVVESSPVWKPGLQRGEPVRVRFSITVKYLLI